MLSLSSSTSGTLLVSLLLVTCLPEPSACFLHTGLPDSSWWCVPAYFLVLTASFPFNSPFWWHTVSRSFFFKKHIWVINFLRLLARLKSIFLVPSHTGDHLAGRYVLEGESCSFRIVLVFMLSAPLSLPLWHVSKCLNVSPDQPLPTVILGIRITLPTFCWGSGGSRW